eukprot:1213833-Lingulodinium_polyedra.AAC.1
MNALYRCVLGCGGSSGILQADHEKTVRSLLSVVAIKLNMNSNAARLQPEISGQCRAMAPRTM